MAKNRKSSNYEMDKPRLTVDGSKMVPGVNSCQYCRIPRLRGGEFHLEKWFCSYACYENYVQDQKDYVGIR